MHAYSPAEPPSGAAGHGAAVRARLHHARPRVAFLHRDLPAESHSVPAEAYASDRADAQEGAEQGRQRGGDRAGA